MPARRPYCLFRTTMPGLVLLVCTSLATGDDSLPKQLRQLDTQVIVLGTVRQQPLTSVLSREAAAGLRAANQADRKAWGEVKSRADWERYRDARLQALRKSLGTFPPVPKDLKVRITGTHEGEGWISPFCHDVLRSNVLLQFDVLATCGGRRPPTQEPFLLPPGA